eukprot:TRINITY_DN4372_c1_g1_i2.p1 TRINITY_DN4372_c1_g1~~TRINITY_DN4372_c1_g1_i2.p1  ORF type:complete len:374 (+),score=60.68 TRINITY_DN4372_c1_g1_i2:54-1124(+)
MNVPFAAAQAVPVQAQFYFTVPAGVGPGQTVRTQTPDGQMVDIEVPQGHGPGTSFPVAYQPRVGAASAPVAAIPMQHAMGPGGFVPQAFGMHPYAGMDPFDILNQLDGVRLKQQAQMVQVLLGWDMPNKYFISDARGGRDLFVAAEKGDGVMGAIGRQVFEGGSRPFNLDIALIQDSPPGHPPLQPVPFVRLERPWKCTCCCLARPHMRIIDSRTHELIGTTVEPFSCCHFRLNLQEPQNHSNVLGIDHHCCDCSILCWGCPCGCQETNFEIKDAASGAVVGHIHREFNTAQAIGMVTGVAADSDQFRVDFKDVHNPKWKAALIAKAIFLDYCYFVKGGRSARDESALGRGIQLFD